ncbi:hypothetical protein PHMEG_00034042 [Phytophthora megakarya]|uniref:Bzip transcription factor n=1 Tax=Phytophthora megakarya TaxID=4795 RepID=A0A225UTH5_9STRA|nr:hypothetical protein PHMEG_00034042 [Phytophthora megakarya]
MSPVRREQCRVNQAKYRKKQQQYAQDLDHRVQLLQDELHYMETKRLNILRNSATEQTVWIVATDYFRHFGEGYRPPSFTIEGTPQHMQLDFLKETMASDVTDGIVCGVKELLERWRLFSLFHGDVNVHLNNLEKRAGGSLLANTTTSITITENTLHHLYPHLVCSTENDDDVGELSPLALKLLNQRLIVRGSVWFGWDEATARVSRLETKIDMLAAMFKLVDNVEDVARVFDGALITTEGAICDRHRS